MDKMYSSAVTSIFRKLVVIFCLSCLPYLAQAQQNILLGFEVNPGVSIISVKDKNFALDGNTYKVKNEGMANLRLYADFLKYDPWVISSGLWFANKKVYIRNSNSGNNWLYHYTPWYLQLPFILKREVIAFDKNLSLQAYGGFSVDFKMSERVQGNDYVYYWKKGNGNPIDFFNPLDFTMHLGVGVQYKIFEEVYLFGGISGSKSFFNMVNPNLRYDDAYNTRVKDALRITSGTFTVDVGIKYLLSL